MIDVISLCKYQSELMCTLLILWMIKSTNKYLLMDLWLVNVYQDKFVDIQDMLKQLFQRPLNQVLK